MNRFTLAAYPLPDLKTLSTFWAADASAVNINKDMHDGDGAEVRIIALVIGRWAPF